jgi:hypothetical protein
VPSRLSRYPPTPLPTRSHGNQSHTKQSHANLSDAMLSLDIVSRRNHCHATPTRCNRNDTCPSAAHHSPCPSYRRDATTLTLLGQPRVAYQSVGCIRVYKYYYLPCLALFVPQSRPIVLSIGSGHLTAALALRFPTPRRTPNRIPAPSETIEAGKCHAMVQRHPRRLP